MPSETGLLGPLEVKAISEALGIRPTKVLGQNFVHDAGTVRKIVAAGGVEEGDEVVEVGPGLGSLTLALLEVGARVRAVEIDPPLAANLAWHDEVRTVAAQRLVPEGLARSGHGRRAEAADQLARRRPSVCEGGVRRPSKGATSHHGR